MPLKKHKKYQFLYHFLPHQQNKTRARLLSHGALLTYLAMVAIMLGLFILIPKLFPGVLGYASSINIKDLFNDTNKIRAQNNLSEFRLNFSNWRLLFRNAVCLSVFCS